MVDFSSAITERGASGNRRKHRGTWTNGATAAKDIDTGLHIVTYMKVQYKGTAVVADAVVINETLPCDGSAVTIVPTGNTQDGYWTAEGF